MTANVPLWEILARSAPRPITPSGPDSIRAQREALERGATRPPGDAVFAPVPAIGGLWTTTPRSPTGRVVLQLHGGGYHYASAWLQRDFTARLADAAGARVLGVDYPLAPEHTFPAPVTAATAAYRWLLESGVSPGRIAVTGDSAGGGLALAVLVTLRDEGTPLPASMVLMSPWADLRVGGASARSRAARDPHLDPDVLRAWGESYLGGADPGHPLASPVHADLSGLPPALVQVGTEEILYDDAVRVAELLDDAELDVAEGMPHLWQMFAGTLPEGARAIERIGRHVRTHDRAETSG
ncbi:alpha/beta hydrolase [Spirillospora sp. CA-294931]|uniref:alpha/beta hydrolase n=1 Tax=Spirillospora sp. CA-294931 TaxID=3240042 RepID=UPI003D8F5D2D